MFCTECGNKLPDHPAAHCPSCGVKLNTAGGGGGTGHHAAGGTPGSFVSGATGDSDVERTVKIALYVAGGCMGIVLLYDLSLMTQGFGAMPLFWLDIAVAGGVIGGIVGALGKLHSHDYAGGAKSCGLAGGVAAVYGVIGLLLTASQLAILVLVCAGCLGYGYWKLNNAAPQT